MTKKVEPAETSTAAVSPRKPYHAPRIEESGEFEHLVLACGRLMGGLDPECGEMPKST